MLQSIHQGPPADAQRHGRLAFHKTTFHSKRHDVELVGVKAWRGKGLKPYANFSFHSEQSAANWMAREIASDAAAEVRRAERKIEAAAALEAMKIRLTVGTILHYSWGYDQTQCEFFQIVERKPGSVVMREIGFKVKPSEHARTDDMSEQRFPAPGEFTGPPILKRISPNGITMDFGTATPTDPDQAHYCSWYA